VAQVQRIEFATTSAEEAHAFFDQNYVGVRARRAGSASNADLRVDTMATGTLAVDRVTNHGLHADTEVDVFPEMTVLTSLGGRLRYEFPRAGEVVCASGSMVHFRDEPCCATWQDFDVLLVRLAWHEVHQAAATLTGLEPGDLRFAAAAPIPQRADLWASTARMLYRELHAGDARITNPLIHRTLFDLVVATAISVFPNTAVSRGYVPGPGDVGPPALRRAVAYIDAHASLPITEADIANTAGSTPRAVRAAFRRQLDTTPLAYLARVRLEAAHRDLQSADPTAAETVAVIAQRWGFPHLAGFSSAYWEAFASEPEATLLS
jgi:AraC-like DNA-binding protein